jgi:hypothetical protein
MKRVILATVLCGALCTPLTAAGPIDSRQQNQKARIRQGVKSGELTRNEARQLIKREARVVAAERKARADGDITRKEARKLDRSLDKASQKIFQQKHDNQDH